ncbi:MAG: alpha/beta hydrolase [Pseudomonadota bacterium]
MKLVLSLAAVLVVVILAVWLKARAHETRAEATYPPEGQLLSVNGYQVHAVVMGPDGEDVPEVVLIHGSSGSTRDMTFKLAPALAERYRVFVFDRPGLGYTDPISSTGASITEQADLLSAAALQIGAQKPVVVGHSYGGAVALAWAVHHPDKISGLVALAAASHPWDTGLTTYYKILSHPVIGPIVIPLITAFVGEERVAQELEGIFLPDQVPEGYIAHFGPDLTLRRSSMRANALQRRNRLAEIEELSPRYPEIDMPVEILHGDQDFAVGYDIHSTRLKNAIDGADLRPLEGHGHMIQHAAPEAVIDAIDRAAARAGLTP